MNKYVGESERAVRQLFLRARSSIPVVIFFDELDALSPKRDGSSSEAGYRVVNTLLTELDGVSSVSSTAGSNTGREGIYVIAATNRPEIIDPAMLRPGRLETLLYVGLPDEEGRVDIMRTLCRQRLPSDFVFDESMANVVRRCVSFSGADLANLLTHAGYNAMRRCDRTYADAGEVYQNQEERIVLEDFQTAMADVRPSVGAEDLQRYEGLRRDWSSRR